MKIKTNQLFSIHIYIRDLLEGGGSNEMPSVQWNHDHRKILRPWGTFLGMEVRPLRRDCRSLDLGKPKPEQGIKISEWHGTPEGKGNKEVKEFS